MVLKQPLRLMLQLVRATCDLPNITFLLLFQRNVVEDALTDAEFRDTAPQHGRSFLEKIVQVSFDMPVVEKAKLRSGAITESCVLRREKGGVLWV